MAVSKLDEYNKRMQLHTANQKAELSAIQQQTNKYMQNYLNQMGMQGSGVGQSYMVQNANNMANMATAINQQANNNIEQYRQGLQTEALSGLQQRLDNPYASAVTLQDYIDRVSASGDVDASTIQEMNDMLATSGVDWNVERLDKAKEIDKLLANNDYKYLKDELASIQNQLRSDDLTLEDYRKLVGETNALTTTNPTEYAEKQLAKGGDVVEGTDVPIKVLNGAFNGKPKNDDWVIREGVGIFEYRNGKWVKIRDNTKVTKAESASRGKDGVRTKRI